VRGGHRRRAGARPGAGLRRESEYGLLAGADEEEEVEMLVARRRSDEESV